MTEGASPDVFDVLVFDGNGPLVDNELAQQILVNQGICSLMGIASLGSGSRGNGTLSPLVGRCF